MVLMTPGMFGNALASPNLYIYDDISKLFKQLTLTQMVGTVLFLTGHLLMIIGFILIG
jgi:hypothetical protein